MRLALLVIVIALLWLIGAYDALGTACGAPASSWTRLKEGW